MGTDYSGTESCKGSGRVIVKIKSSSTSTGANNLRVIAIVSITIVAVGIIVAAMFLIAPSDQKPVVKSPGTLNISGSTTIQPVSESLANAYMIAHPDVKITVEGGGSGAGIQKAGLGQTDIGSSSRNLNSDELAKFPYLQGFKIGGSAVVVIVNRNYPADEATKQELLDLYDNSSGDISHLPDLGGIRTVIQRSDDSGTEQTFAQWLNASWTNVSASMGARDYGGSEAVIHIAVPGNEEVVKAVVDHPNSIGFVDFGFAEREPGVKILKLRLSNSSDALPSDIATARESIREELNNVPGNNTYYISQLTRPLLYITNGTPTPLENSFISFAQSNESKKYFDDVGYFSITELGNNP